MMKGKQENAQKSQKLVPEPSRRVMTEEDKESKEDSINERDSDEDDDIVENPHIEGSHQYDKLNLFQDSHKLQ